MEGQKGLLYTLYKLTGSYPRNIWLMGVPNNIPQGSKQRMDIQVWRNAEFELYPFFL